MKKNKDTDYIYDQSFIDWVLGANAENNAYWNDYVNNNPAERASILRAKELIIRLQPHKIAPSSEMKKNVWMNISKQLDTYSSRKRLFGWRAVAAVAAVLILVGAGVLYKFSFDEPRTIDYKSIAKTETTANQVKLVLADETEKFLSSSSPNLEYNSKGSVLIDSVITVQQTPDS